MTREHFENIAKTWSFKDALDVFSEECDEISTTSMLEDQAKYMIDMGYYDDAEDICHALRTKENYTSYWVYSFSEGEIIPVDSIEDIEDLLE